LRSTYERNIVEVSTASLRRFLHSTLSVLDFGHLKIVPMMNINKKAIAFLSARWQFLDF